MVCVEETYFNKHYNLCFYYVIYKIYAKFFHFKLLTDKDVNLINSIENDIYENLKIRIHLKVRIKSEIKKFLLLEKLYLKILKTLNIQHVILVVGYLKPYLISARKKLGIKTYEMQHGIITKYHLGYSYPNNDYVQYSSDYLLTFGDYWIETTPIASNTLFICLWSPRKSF